MSDPARPLASLPPGGQALVSEVRLGQDERLLPDAPLQPGALVQILEAKPGWLHVRIDFREYPVPLDLAERVLVTPLADSASVGAGDAYAVLLSRRGRGTWRVRVVARADGAIVASETFGDEEPARSRWRVLRRDADVLDAAGFRRRHGLP